MLQYTIYMYERQREKWDKMLQSREAEAAEVQGLICIRLSVANPKSNIYNYDGTYAYMYVYYNHSIHIH